MPAVSAKSIVKATAPWVSPAARVKVAVQSFPLTLATVTDPSAEAPPTETATVGAAMVSLTVNERVTVSPTLAISFVALLEALSESMDTLDSVGAVESKVTEEESVVEVTRVPALPIVSTKSIVKVTAPSVSPSARVKVAVQSFPLTLTTVTDPSAATPPTETDTAEVKPSTSTGVELSVVVPSPSWP